MEFLRKLLARFRKTKEPVIAPRPGVDTLPSLTGREPDPFFLPREPVTKEPECEPESPETTVPEPPEETSPGPSVPGLGLPEWVTTIPLPEKIMAKGKIEGMVLVGLEASEITLAGQGLYGFFQKNVLPKVDSEEDEAFVFASWFNCAKTGLEAVVAANDLEDLYTSFVGRKAGGIEGMGNMSHELNPEEIKAARTLVREEFRKLGIQGEPKLNFIYDFTP